MDDVVLSCEAWVGRSQALDVVTIFCGRPVPPQRTEWDAYAEFVDSDHAISSRLSEDNEAFRGTPHRRHHLELLDSQYLDRPRADHEAAVVCDWIDSWVANATDPLVLIPVGAGLRPPVAVQSIPVFARVAVPIERRLRRVISKFPSHKLMTGRPPHPDHVWVADVISDHLAGSDVSLGFYSEVPYGRGGTGGRAMRARGIRHGWEPIHPEQVVIDRRAKAERIAAYRSQIPQTSDRSGRLDDPAALEPTETYWLRPSRAGRRGS